MIQPRIYNKICYYEDSKALPLIVVLSYCDRTACIHFLLSLVGFGGRGGGWVGSFWVDREGGKNNSF